MIRLLQVAIILALLGPIASFSVADDPPRQGDLQTAITNLAAEDPVTRRQAEQHLRSAGREARSLLLQAAGSADPAIAHAARELLLSIPWFQPDDPPAARRILEGYGAKDADGRRQTIVELADRVGHDAGNLLLRLLTEDPSDAVRWQIVAVLQANRTLISPDLLRELDENADNAPILAARATALTHETPDDPEAVIVLYRRILELESRNPTPDHGALYPIFNYLLGYHLVNRQFDQAAELCRIAIFRALAIAPDTRTQPILRLFALHAAFGPLPGFARDVQDHLPHLEPALQVHAMAEVVRGSGNWMAAMPMQSLAWSLGSESENPLAVADWLMVSGWHRAAQAQLRYLLRQDLTLPQQIDIHLRLAHMHGYANEDAVTIAHLQAVLRLLDKFDGILLRGGNRSGIEWLREQLHWRQLREAQRKDDRAAMETHVESLLRTMTTDADILGDLVPALEALGRAAEGDRLFDHAYQELKSLIDANPEDPTLHNNMAWLLARTSRRLDEALKFATWATTANPYNSAFLDTLAEIHYRRGNPEQSVELESKALLLSPRDPFMTRQLEKYRTAVEGK